MHTRYFQFQIFNKQYPKFWNVDISNSGGRKKFPVENNKKEKNFGRTRMIILYILACIASASVFLLSDEGLRFALLGLALVYLVMLIDSSFQ